MKKMTLASMDIAEHKREDLKRIFPEVFSEERIDFDQLKRVLGDWVASDAERFGLNWPGKAECMKIIQKPSSATLKPLRDESVHFDATENLFIEGENLEVLKLLQRAYFGKVKMISIDPPYNTGKEFIYPDKYCEELKTYLAYTGQVDGDGRKFSTNVDTDGRYHSRWLNMMYPRLYIARNLLREDGVIFVNIDDNEVHHLRMVMDLIFGEENFVGNIAWKKTSGDNKPSFAFTHDNIVIYGKTSNQLPRVRLTGPQRLQYKNPDNDPRGDWAQTDYRSRWTKNERPNLYYAITQPNTKEKIFPDTHTKSTRVWGCEKNVHKENERNGLVWWGKDGLAKEPKRKRFLFDHRGVNTRSVWDDAGTNDSASGELAELFPECRSIFDNPKPISLLKKIISIASDKSYIVLDFFAGSATTAHAVMQLNAEDGGKRKYICVQLPEPTNEKSEAHKAGYETIADIAKERIRRAAAKIEDELNGQLDLNGNGQLDLGFKAFKLDSSNFRIWDGDVEDTDALIEQLELQVDRIDKEGSAEDILYEILLNAGLPLTAKIEKQVVEEKEVFSIADGEIRVCLERELTTELFDALAKASPSQVICLDEAFYLNDELKVNAGVIFKFYATANETEMVFKTI